MFKQLFEFVRQSLFLQHDVRELKENVASLERELHETNEAVRQLAFQFQHLSERDQHEREKLMLKMENLLLRTERLTPPAKKQK